MYVVMMGKGKSMGMRVRGIKLEMGKATAYILCMEECEIKTSAVYVTTISMKDLFM